MEDFVRHLLTYYACAIIISSYFPRDDQSCIGNRLPSIGVTCCVYGDQVVNRSYKICLQRIFGRGAGRPEQQLKFPFQEIPQTHFRPG